MKPWTVAEFRAHVSFLHGWMADHGLAAQWVNIVFTVGPADDFRQARAFAYCTDTRPITVVVAPDFAEQDRARQIALIRHELGHALEFMVGRSVVLNILDAAGYDLDTWGGTERRADALAEIVFEAPIAYDRADVQTLGAGTRPRPSRLGGC